MTPHALRDPATRHKVDTAIRELRRRRVSYVAISHAMDVFDVIALDPGQVRYRAVAKLGLPRNPNKTRPVIAKNQKLKPTEDAP